MADDLGISNHLSVRGGMYQYVRRVPEDLRGAFPFPRIQKSLGTRDQRQARAAALDLDRLWDERFNEARNRKGLESAPARTATVTTHDWAWSDWEDLAIWFGASLAEDWRARLGGVKGHAFGAEPDRAHLPWRPDAIVKEHIARGIKLSDMSVAEYADKRVSFVQSYVRRIGIALSKTDPEFERFMAACLKAELDYLDVFQQREARRGGLDHPHPDSVWGPWRSLRAGQQIAAGMPLAPAARAPETVPLGGKTLTSCRAKWIENRTRAKKKVRADYLREMDLTISAFEGHAGVSDIGEIRRRHVLAYRDHLESTTEYKVATINKKVGYISALMRAALKAGWIEVSLGENLFLEVPEDEGGREPYAEDDFKKIFSH